MDLRSELYRGPCVMPCPVCVFCIRCTKNFRLQGGPKGGDREEGRNSLLRGHRLLRPVLLVSATQ